MHVSSELAPCTSEYLPAPHATQASDSVVALYLVAYFPASHGVQVLTFVALVVPE